MQKGLLHLLEQSQGSVSFSLFSLTEADRRNTTVGLPPEQSHGIIVYFSYLCTPDNSNLMKFLIHSGRGPISYLIPICWQNLVSNAAYQITPKLSLK